MIAKAISGLGYLPMTTAQEHRTSCHRMLPWGLARCLPAWLRNRPRLKTAAFRSAGTSLPPLVSGRSGSTILGTTGPKVVSVGMTLDYGHNPLIYNLVRADGSVAQTPGHHQPQPRQAL